MEACWLLHRMKNVEKKAVSVGRVVGLSLLVQGSGWAHSQRAGPRLLHATFLQQKAGLSLAKMGGAHTGLSPLCLGIEANIPSGRAPWLLSEQRLCPATPWAAPGGCPVARAWSAE